MSPIVIDRIYVAGPMTGKPQFNIPAFDAASADLRERGYDVVSPAELDDENIRTISLASPDGAMATLTTHGQTHGDFLARDIKIIADGGITAIWVLPGWERSPGALWETFAGHLKGLPIIAYANGEAVSARDRVRAWARGLWSEVELTVIREALNERPTPRRVP